MRRLLLFALASIFFAISSYAELITYTIEFKRSTNDSEGIEITTSTRPHELVKCGAGCIAAITKVSDVKDCGKYGLQFGESGELQIEFSHKVKMLKLQPSSAIYFALGSDNSKFYVNNIELGGNVSGVILSSSLSVSNFESLKFKSEGGLSYLNKIELVFDDSEIDPNSVPPLPEIESHEIEYDENECLNVDILSREKVRFAALTATSFSYTIGDNDEPINVETKNGKFEYKPSDFVVGNSQILYVTAHNDNGASDCLKVKLNYIEAEIPAIVEFSHPSGDILKGTAVSLNSDRFAYSITYSFDNENWYQYNEPIVIKESCTIYAIAYNQDAQRSELASVTYNVKEPIRYVRVDDPSQIVDGTYIVAAFTADNTVAVAGSYNKNEYYFYYVTNGIIVDENQIVRTEDVFVQEYTIAQSSKYYTIELRDTGKYIFVKDTPMNYQLGANPSRFTIKLGENGDVCIQEVNYLDRCMLYNNNSNSFRNYGVDKLSDDKYREVYLYRLVDKDYAVSPESNVLFMHGVYWDRVYDLSNPVVLGREGTTERFSARSIYIGNDNTSELGYFFSTGRDETSIATLSTEGVEALGDWSQLGTIYHAAGVSKGTSEGVVPFTVPSRGLYDILIDFSGVTPEVTATPTDITTSVNLPTTTGEVEYYNLQGTRVDRPSTGIYIRKEGLKVSKVIVR